MVTTSDDTNKTLDILTNNNNYRECSTRCELICNYSPSLLITDNDMLHSVENNTYFTYFLPDDDIKSSVTYNKRDYKLESIIINLKPLHSYNGTFEDGEIILIHMEKITGISLNICIPIKVRNINSNSPLDNLLNETDFQLEGMEIKSFRLNELIPKANTLFYQYSSNYDYKVDNVVFSNKDSIIINHSSYNRIKNLFLDNTRNAEHYLDENQLNSVNIYVNKNGVNNNLKLDNDIYIECNPTDSNGEILVSESKSNFTHENKIIIKIMKYLEKFNIKITNSMIKALLFSILGLIIFVIVSLIIHYSFKSLEKYTVKQNKLVINNVKNKY